MFKMDSAMQDRVNAAGEFKRMSCAMPIEIKEVSAKEDGSADTVIEGYASVFNAVDNGMDVVNPGAFRKSLGERTVRMLWQHDMAQPIGKWDEMREDERGLFVRGTIFANVARGKDAIALIKGKAIEGLSIGYRTKEAASEGNGSIRRLMEVDLYEVSLVTMPMLDSAGVTNFKASAINTIREFEATLRDLGFSRTEATAIASGGWKALDHRRDAETVDSDELAKAEALAAAINRLMEGFENV